jgi:acetyltransferase-like isoleucine patch superfamily enzyme
MNEVAIHETADVSSQASIGAGTKIWNWAQVREGVIIGKDCVLSKGVYVDRDVHIGDLVKIQNNASLFHGVTIEDGVFVGPHVCFTNDLNPRAVTKDFQSATDDDWTESVTVVKRGASIGANSTIVAGITIGEFALIGAGSTVTRDVPPYTLVYGNPAQIHGKVNESGEVL